MLKFGCSNYYLYFSSVSFSVRFRMTFICLHLNVEALVDVFE